MIVLFLLKFIYQNHINWYHIFYLKLMVVHKNTIILYGILENIICGHFHFKRYTHNT